jgi:hypothetical protein
MNRAATAWQAIMQPVGGNKLEVKGVKLASGAEVAVQLTAKQTGSKVRGSFTIK